MAIDNGRRQFMTGYPLLHTFRIFESFKVGIRESEQREELDQFFKTYETSYALTLAYPDELILASARKCGIETENRNKSDIIKDLFMQKGGY